MTAYISTGITVSFSTLSGELLDINIPGESADMVDVTYQASTNEWREYLAGLKDGNEVTISLHAGATIPAVATSGTLTITFPTGAGTFTASALLSKGRGASATLGDKITDELTFKITGEPEWS